MFKYNDTIEDINRAKTKTRPNKVLDCFSKTLFSKNTDICVCYDPLFLMYNLYNIFISFLFNSTLLPLLYHVYG